MPPAVQVGDLPKRVVVTALASEWIERLKSAHGDLLFHQSGGCCDGSSPMCFLLGEFKLGQADVRLGDVCGVDFYMSAAQFEYWKHTQLIIDVVPGRGSGFSLEAPEGIRFLTRSQIFTDDEISRLDAAGDLPRGL